MPVPNLNIGDRRWCMTCRKALKIEEFEAPTKETCKKCGMARKGEVYGDLKRRASKEIFKNIVEGMTTKKLEVPHTSELAAEIIGKHGGLSNFSDFLYQQGMAAATERPGSRACLDYCKLIANLIVKSTDQNTPQMDPTSLTDEDIEKHIEASLELMLESHPDVVSRVLETTHRRLDSETLEEPGGESTGQA